MKVITKSKLPKWLIFILPFNEEEYVLKGIVIPLILFAVLAAWISLYEYWEPSLDLIKFLMAVFFLGLLVVCVWWLISQVDILHLLRERLKLHYHLTKDEEERIMTKKRLRSLCMKV